ncbi:MAG: hypothetical protein QOI38_1286 [Sphingomonadales bacterium]|jgi:hypothetical protein|nr:hypothetical protein [Sphingomonadales bacterium]
MASTFLHEAQRSATRGSMDLPLAVLAGLSVGFVAFAMPADLLARAVEASQLPSLLSAAAPPLGAKARIAFTVAAAGGTVLAVYLLLRMLGRQAKPRVRAEQPLELEPQREPETPRLRRADVHPDAPARRPILATRELGEPVPAPHPVPVPAEPEPAPEAELDEPEAELELIDRVEPADAEPVWPEPTVSVPEPESQPPAAEDEPIVPAAAEPAEDASIADLMARLERGLARRLQQNGAPAADPVEKALAQSAAFTAPDAGDDRLRSAIENLQRMAARA